MTDAPDPVPATNTVTATWAGGLRFVHRSASGHAVVSDAPAAVGGDDSAPTPMELVLLGLIGCTGVDVASILQGMRQPFTALEVSASSERAEEHPRVYTRIHLTYRLRGDLDPQKVRRAIHLSEHKYCSVSAMLSPAVALSRDFELLP